MSHPIYLEMKIKGENSMLEKRSMLEDAEGVALQDLRDMVKAILPES